MFKPLGGLEATPIKMPLSQWHISANADVFTHFKGVV